MANNNTPTREFIYAIQSVNLKTVKIGFSTDVNQRLAGMQTGSPDELKVIGCWKGTQSEEQTIHALMAQWRLHREWFFPSPEVMTLISERNQALKTEISGKLRIDLSDGHSVDIWETCRDDQRNRYKVTHGYRAAIDILSKAGQLSSSLPPHYAIVADEISAAAQVVVNELNKPRIFGAPMSRPEVSPSDRHCYRITCGGKRYTYSAGSLAHALRLIFSEYKFTKDAASDIGVELLPDDQMMTMHNTVDGVTEKDQRSYKDWAESKEGFIGIVIESPVIRHCYLIQVSKDYVFSATSKSHAVELWLKKYSLNGDTVSNLSVKELPDNANFLIRDNDAASTMTYKEWADTREGFIAVMTKTGEFDYPPMRDLATKAESEIASLTAITKALTASVNRLRESRPLTLREIINRRTLPISVEL